MDGAVVTPDANGDVFVAPGLHSWEVDSADGLTVLAQGTIDCPTCNASTPTPTTQVEGISGTPPAVTPPPTDTLASSTVPSNDGWRMALAALAGVIALALIVPKPKRATAKRR